MCFMAQASVNQDVGKKGPMVGLADPNLFTISLLEYISFALTVKQVNPCLQEKRCVHALTS